MVVRDIILKTGLQQPVNISLGDVELKEQPTAAQTAIIENELLSAGFEILTDQKKQLIENIKRVIIEHIQKEKFDNVGNFSNILSSVLNKDYSYLSKLFSEVEEITIEKYIIDQKIERAKELLTYGELTLSEISFKLGYSSVAHLSAQFKKTTGFNPSDFRKLKHHHRKALDNF